MSRIMREGDRDMPIIHLFPNVIGKQAAVAPITLSHLGACPEPAALSPWRTTGSVNPADPTLPSRR